MLKWQNNSKQLKGSSRKESFSLVFEAHIPMIAFHGV